MGRRRRPIQGSSRDEHPLLRMVILRRELVAELLTWLAKQLVDDPDAVRVEQVEREDATVLELYVAPEDRGKVIGRQGRLARALRTIVRASAAGSRKRVILDIVE